MMKKVLIIIGAAVGILLFGAAVYFGYQKFFKFQNYAYEANGKQSATTGTMYTLKFYRGSTLVSKDQISKSTSSLSSLPQSNQQLLGHKLKDDVGILFYVSPWLKRNEPLSETCTTKDSSYRFSINGYAVCPHLNESGKSDVILAKLGKDGKYFIAFILPWVNAERVTEQKDKAYAQKVLAFDLLDYQKDIEAILTSITPVE